MCPSSEETAILCFGVCILRPFKKCFLHRCLSVAAGSTVLCGSALDLNDMLYLFGIQGFFLHIIVEI